MHIPALTRIRRLATVLVAAAGMVVTAAATPALAGSPSAHHPSAPAHYLALGDSIPFGFYNTTDTSLYADPNNFVGYPELLAREFHLQLANASCPGETTGSFINPTPANIYKCEGVYHPPAPLHVNYTGSQLDFAIRYLNHTPNVRLVTLQLGANDVFRCQAVTSDNCTDPTELAAVLAQVHQNIATILEQLRSQTDYRGPVVVVDYWAPNYADPTAVQGALALDKAIDSAALLGHARIASGFLAYAPIALRRGGGDTVKAGLIRPGDVHPTRFGQDVLEEAVERVIWH